MPFGCLSPQRLLNNVAYHTVDYERTDGVVRTKLNI